MTPNATCIATISGRIVDLAAPTADMIDIDDIAHALSNICRYNGHVEYHYSVAQHSCVVHDLLAESAGSYALCLAGLLHDAHEAYTGDIVTPLKQILGGALLRTELLLDRAIYEAAGILHEAWFANGVVKGADRIAYAWERRDVAYVDGCWDVPDVALPADRLIPWQPMRARDEFLHRYHQHRPKES